MQVVLVAEELRQLGGLLGRQRLRVERVGGLEQALLREGEEHQVERHVVEHDRDDDLVGAGARLEETGEAGPQGAGDHRGDQGQGQVEHRRQVELVGDPAGCRARQQHLPAAADVEHARPEPDTDAEAGQDQRRGELRGVRERPDALVEGVGVGVVDRAAEQRGVRAPHGVPGGLEEVTGPRADVPGRVAHVLVGRGDEHRADQDREEHGQGAVQHAS